MEDKQNTEAASITKEIEDWCSKIENQEIYLECSGYEVYGEHYWDRDWEFEYTALFDVISNHRQRY